MKKKTLKDRLFCVFLSLLIIFTSLPSSIFAKVQDDVFDTNGQKDSNVIEEVDTNDVYVDWEFENSEITSSQEGILNIEAKLNTDNVKDINAVSVEIVLTNDEAIALGILSEDGLKLNEDAFKSEVENSENGLDSLGNNILPKMEEDKSVHLVIGLDKENSSLSYQYKFNVPSSLTLPFTINVDENDIVVNAMGQSSEAIDGVNVEKNTNKITITKEEQKEDLNNDIKENKALKETESLENKAIEDSVTINSYLTNFSKEIFWVDNNNESSIRPNISSYSQPILQFSFDGKTYKTLTKDNMEEVGLQSYPKFSVDNTGVGVYTISAGNRVLPSNVTYEDIYGNKTSYDVSWEIIPTDVSGYAMVEVTDENKNEYPSVDNTGWYYILLRDLRFTCVARMGDNDHWEEVSDALLNDFRLVIEIKNRRYEEHILSEFENTYLTDHPDDDSMTLAIDNTWKYNIDGSLITYYIEEIPDSSGNADNKVYVENAFDEDDYLSVSYDNSSSPNYGSRIDNLYSEGTVILTLTGEKTYEAKKVWLDDGTTETKQDRPSGIFQLWRYREGTSFSTASVVRNDDGTMVEIKLNNATDEQTLIFELDGSRNLPKYDAEGYEYFYVLREYLEGDNAGNYEQVFGSVDQNGNITDRVDINGEIKDTTNTSDRANNNDFIYNGGVITNRIKGTVSTEVTKIWEASSFQSGFDDVSVEFSLQQRVKGTQTWINTTQTLVMDDFYAENLTDTKTKSMPKYDNLGRELEYRWVESGVYKAGGSNLFKANADGSGTFALTLDNREIEFLSTPTIDEDNPQHTIVTNTIENTIKYDVIKKWHDADGHEINAPAGAKIKFNIYQMLNNEYTYDDPVAVFEMDGVVDTDKTLVNANLGIYAQEISPWMVRVTPLDEFNEEGMQYEYFLTEANQDYLPDMETTRTVEGYESTIVNAPGPGNRILVAKGWIDDSDIAHRENVTISVYNRETNEKINEVTLGDGVWYDYVGIGNLNEENVYILETKVGDTNIPLDTYYLDQGQTPNYDNPKAPDEYDDEGDTNYTSIQYETQYHRYDVKYTSEEIGGEKVYKAVNRRLGNINLTVEKTWVDGDGSLRSEIQKELQNIEENQNVSLSLVAQLDFATDNNPSYYKITRNGVDNADSVVIGNSDNYVAIKDNNGNNVSSTQKILWADGENSKCYFFNLPKYNKSGSVASYKISEVWVDSNGTYVALSTIKNKYPKLYELYSQYSSSITSDEYTVGDHFANDTQDISIRNALTGSKTLSWEKVWKDDYMFENGHRMDLYLDIYQVTHEKDENGNVEEKTSLYVSNYRWVYSDIEGSDPVDQWKVLFNNVPKYDDLGYEIMYYAVERTNVDFKKFDYQVGNYYVVDEEAENQSIYLGTRDEVDSEYEDYVLDLSNVQDKPNVSDYANYALIEGGIFENTIYSDLTIQGQKIWSAVPSSYPNEDLPGVTFTLYQKLASESGDGSPVATITVDKWSDIYKNGSYLFQVLYLGENALDSNNDTIYAGQGEAKKIPKYNEDGKLYSYELKESEIYWADGANPAIEDVFDNKDNHTYLVENAYNSKKGELSIKKFMELSFDENGDPKAFPGVTFTLYRTYTKNDGTTSQKEAVMYKTWTANEVQNAYETKHLLGLNPDAGTDADPLEKEILFEDLDIYAPNGSKYVYSVEENKNYLGGIDNWVVNTDFEKENIPNIKTDTYAGIETGDLYPSSESLFGPAPSATFVNAPDDVRDTVNIRGTKVWNDYKDTFGFRPGDIELTLYKYANEQPGQGNSISEEKVDESLYEITWTQKSENNWTYEITGKVTGELEKYAPNGMVWKYVVKETLSSDSNYVVSPSDGNSYLGKVTENRRENDNSNIIMNNLSNNITTNIPYSKNWVDNDGNIIDNDYLGYDLTVDFELQVSEMDSSDKSYKNAYEYFKDNLTEANYNAIFNGYQFDRSLTGRINDSTIWGVNKSYANLPRIIIKKDAQNNEVTRLQYRVLEKTIHYGSDDSVASPTTVTVVETNNGSGYIYNFNGGMFTPAYWANGKDQPETTYNNNATRVMYNRLETTSFEFTKNWVGDNNNIYSQRPKTSQSGYTWQASFIVQRKSAAGDWENVEIYASNQTSKDMIVTIYGTNSDEDNSVTTTVSGLPKSDVNGNEYEYRVRELDSNYTLTDGHVKDEDIVGNNGDNTYNSTYTTTYNSNTVTNTLDSTKVYALKKWNPSSKEVNVTLEVKYLASNGTTWRSFSTPAKVTLTANPVSNPTKPYYECEEWRAVWNDLPLVVSGSKLDANGHTQYKVFETVPSGYIQESTNEVSIDSYTQFEFTNVESTSYSVEKVWYGVDSTKQGIVRVGLYRTIGEIGDSNSEPVMQSGTTNQMTVLLTKTNLKATFNSLPKYDVNGNEYIYYARELSIDGISIENYDYRILNNDEAGKTTITNIGKKEITGKKIWQDSSNEYNTRPYDITINIYRSVKGSDKVKLNTAPIWTNTDTDEWEYKFEGLLATDDNGNIYTYEVEEVVPEEYAVTYDGYNIINTLSDTINIPIKKVWDDMDNYDKVRPKNIKVELYADNVKVNEATLKGKTNTWEYVFENLPEYNSLNKRIVYTVKEVEVPDGYKVTYDGYTITNYRDVVIDDKTRKSSDDTDSAATSDMNNINLYIILVLCSFMVIGIVSSKLIRDKRFRK
ncbi:Cna B-type domain-containing protein [Anaerofustis sp. NSJ-163]|uniref:Cna B-type domain-containing protein n=1 Tax=Anaerofustis sp. NSJ-163 TaxID=2944391 RepID=UPI00209C625F|nr:Cna B-type domain-containing protein [Anaerofustis sp. NSJ-163]MCO8193852.1 Cna B-type domain-containing protein [Anaerofustis sp. NSJ-163]